MKKQLAKLTSKRYIALITAIIAGAIGGYIYYLEVGCVSGTCAITSNPYLSTFWGGLLGWVLGDTILGKKKVEKAPQSPEQE
ncbi:MAG: hypothetical protein K9I94_00995 [Bacteroidales bacterium]|nr:hypothetical protein [Bacteroidales bacterium]